MSILKVRKTIISEAIQINSPEDEAQVREWLKEFLGEATAQAANLEQLKSSRVYFMRDSGSPIVYITGVGEFEKDYEEAFEETDDFGF